MRSILRQVWLGCLALLGITGLIYIGDGLWARYQGRPTEQIKVDHIYATMNHFNQVEYAVGPSAMETCVDALMPHFGHTPCWYLRRHTLLQIGNP
jgi:hypothetical protein